MPAGVYTRTEYHRKRLREGRVGLSSPNNGKIASLETRRKMSLAHKGQVVSAATRLKIAMSFARTYKKENHPRWQGGITPTSTKRWRQRHRDLANFWTSQRRKRLRNCEGSHSFQEWLEVKRKFHNC